MQVGGADAEEDLGGLQLTEPSPSAGPAKQSLLLLLLLHAWTGGAAGSTPKRNSASAAAAAAVQLDVQLDAKLVPE